MSTNLAPSQRFDPLSHGVGGGYEGVFSSALGPQQRVPDTNPFEQRNYSINNMPSHKEGSSLVVRDTFEDYWLTAAYDWPSVFIMPTFKSDEIEMTWKEWITNPAYMGPTPHQATSRVLTNRRVIRRASMIRRGLTYEWEGDSLYTPGGRSAYWASVAAMARAWQETVNVEVLRALRHCHSYEQKRVRDFELVPLGDLDRYHERAISRFMIIQKSNTGINQLNTMVDVELEQVGGVADAWIFSRPIMDFCQDANPQFFEHKLGGNLAVDMFHGAQVSADAAGNTMGSVQNIVPRLQVKGSPVFLAKSYRVEGIGMADLLSQVTEVGIYNLMDDRTRNHFAYSADSRNIKVYSNFADDYVEIQFEKALRNLGIWDKNGNLIDPHSGRGVSPAHGMDTEDDFLSFRNGASESGKRSSLKFYGDMSANHLPASALLNVGRSMVHALSFADSSKAKELLDMGEKMRPGVDARGDTADLLERMANLVGTEDNLFLTGGDKSAREQPTIADRVQANVINAGFAQETVRRPSAGYSAIGSAAQEETHRTFLTSIIAAPLLLDEHKADAARVAADSRKSVQSRANAIKGIILSALEADAGHVTKLDTPAAVDEWFQQRMSKYADRQQAEASRGAAPVAEEVQGEARWVRVAAGIGSTVPALRTIRNPGSRTPLSRDEEQARRNVDRAGPMRGFDPRYANLSNNMQAIRDASAPKLVKYCAMLFCGARFNRDRLIAIHNEGVYVPLNIMLARPHCTYKTRMGIKVGTGGSVGFTAYGYTNMGYGHDAGNKTGFLHYTAYISAVVTDPKNVVVVPNVFCERYLGGMGTDFWDAQSYKGTSSRRSRSIIAIPLPPTIRELEKRIDIRGRWYTEQKLGYVTNERFERPHYPGAARINYLFGLHTATNNVPNSARTQKNHRLSRGATIHLNPISNRWDDYVWEQSEFGPNVYAGVGRIRNGGSEMIKDLGGMAPITGY